MELRQIYLAVVFAIVALGCSLTAWAASGPTSASTVTPGFTSTFDAGNYGPISTPAIAGNITALVITGISQTRSWQGYYGNITGTITLDDAVNFTFYNWNAVHPHGQIYATLNSSIGWTSVDCFNYTDDVTDLSVIDAFYGIAANDPDAVNVTFNDTNHPTFQIGSRDITGCPTTYIWQNDTEQRANFINVLLYDNGTVNSTGWIYATIIENRTASSLDPATCYNGQQCDFQILVNEDGHGTDVETTPYYFWIELV